MVRIDSSPNYLPSTSPGGGSLALERLGSRVKEALAQINQQASSPSDLPSRTEVFNALSQITSQPIPGTGVAGMMGGVVV